MAKKVLIAGNNKNIGRGVALEYARSGCDIGFTYDDAVFAEEVEKELGAYGIAVRSYAYIPTDVEAPHVLVDEFVRDFGGIDILVNAPGMLKYYSFLDVEPGNWNELFENNYQSSYFAAQTAVKYMSEGNVRGNIINIFSDHEKLSWPEDTLFGTFSAALKRLTETMAFDASQYGIRVNGIAPGYIKESWAEADDDRTLSEVKKQILSRIPMKTMTDAAEIGRVAVFLTSELVPTLTGQTVFVDGGAVIPVVCENHYMPGATEEDRNYRRRK